MAVIKPKAIMAPVRFPLDAELLDAPLIDIAFGDSSLRSSGDTVAETLPTH